MLHCIISHHDIIAHFRNPHNPFSDLMPQLNDSPATFRDTLRDFTADRSLLKLTAMAVVVGTGGAASAWVLLRLIALITNLVYFQQISVETVSFAGRHLPLWTILVPVAGSIVIGLMARYGSEKIRGHGIPEAIEAILLGQSRIEPKVALLKPLSSAISIGTGGPFGRVRSS
jgi:H+/Cl- antiporter ClcA